MSERPAHDLSGVLLPLLLCVWASSCEPGPWTSDAPRSDPALPALVVRISEEYANINTDVSSRTLARYGIVDGDAFSLRYGEHQFRALLGKDYSDVPRGDWIALIERDGEKDYLQLAISFGNAATEIGCAAGDTLYIEKLTGGE